MFILFGTFGGESYIHFAYAALLLLFIELDDISMICVFDYSLDGD